MISAFNPGGAWVGTWDYPGVLQRRLKMPKHNISFTVAFTVKAKVDPDELEGFDGDSAEEADVEQYIKDYVLDGSEDLLHFISETDPDTTINGISDVKSKLLLTSDEEEE
jgi:hypothetical protein